MQRLILSDRAMFGIAFCIRRYASRVATCPAPTYRVSLRLK